MHHNNVDITNDDDNGIDDVVTRVEMETTDYSKSCYWTWDNDDYDNGGDGDDGDDHDDGGDDDDGNDYDDGGDDNDDDGNWRQLISKSCHRTWGSPPFTFPAYSCHYQ